jgi:hypothetical protein
MTIKGGRSYPAARQKSATFTASSPPRNRKAVGDQRDKIIFAAFVYQRQNGLTLAWMSETIGVSGKDFPRVRAHGWRCAPVARRRRANFFAEQIEQFRCHREKGSAPIFSDKQTEQFRCAARCKGGPLPPIFYKRILQTNAPASRRHKMLCRAARRPRAPIQFPEGSNGNSGRGPPETFAEFMEVTHV